MWCWHSTGPAPRALPGSRKSISWLRSCIPEMPGTRSAPALLSWMPKVASCSWDNALHLAGENVAIRVCLGRVPTRALAFHPNFRAIKLMNFKLFCLQTLKISTSNKACVHCSSWAAGVSQMKLCSLESCGCFLGRWGSLVSGPSFSGVFSPPWSWAVPPSLPGQGTRTRLSLLAHDCVDWID